MALEGRAEDRLAGELGFGREQVTQRWTVAVQVAQLDEGAGGDPRWRALASAPWAGARPAPTPAPGLSWPSAGPRTRTRRGPCFPTRGPPHPERLRVAV